MASGKRKKNTHNQQRSIRISSQLAYELSTKISIHRGSITDLHVDAIVNAANSALWAGAGVCGAIFKAAGRKALQRECGAIIDKIGHIPTGQSVLTHGHKLHAKYIIHSVGPTSHDNQKLKLAYTSALELCLQHNIRSIAFPCISTGVFGFSTQVQNVSCFVIVLSLSNQ